MTLIRSNSTESATDSIKTSQFSNFSAKNVDQGNIILISSSINSNWILDSGATNPVCMNLSFFFSYEIPINLPNGSSVFATHKGNV